MGSVSLPNNGARRVDVFVQVRPCDFASVVGCVELLRRGIGPAVGRLSIVTAALPEDVRRQLQAMGCEFLNEKDIFGFDASAISGSPAARERLFGHFVKWELRRFSQTPTYLVIEADQALTAPISLVQANLQTLFCENRFRFGYLMCFNYFFGQLPYPASPAIAEIQQFDCGVLDEMIAKIQAKYSLPWAQATFEILRQVRGTAFDAGQAYGHYLHLFRPGSFAVQPWTAAQQNTDAPVMPVVRMSTLGFNGRFGNQLFQYAYLLLYARREKLQAQCPPWIGCSLFGHQNTIDDRELPIYREHKGDTAEMIRFDPDQRYEDFELWGYFQDVRDWAGDRDHFRGLFQPLVFLKSPLDAALRQLRAGGRTLVAIHLRRGDFDGRPLGWPAPEAWYLRWLEQLWPTLVNPVLYVATDDPVNVLPQFAAYSFLSTSDLKVTVNGAEFYTDFYVLSQADVLGISNSTFSFAAAMMNTTAKVFARPDPVAQRMVSFDPWNTTVHLPKLTAQEDSLAA